VFLWQAGAAFESLYYPRALTASPLNRVELSKQFALKFVVITGNFASSKLIDKSRQYRDNRTLTRMSDYGTRIFHR
jgi:hypothetical protein